MKAIKIFLAMMIASLMNLNVNAQVDSSATKSTGMVTQTVKVFGECGMCKSRIEKNALKIDGVKSAKWDDDTQLLTVSYQEKGEQVLDLLQKKMALIGHDTEAYRANDKAYKALPACCHYERKP